MCNAPVIGFPKRGGAGKCGNLQTCSVTAPCTEASVLANPPHCYCNCNINVYLFEILESFDELLKYLNTSTRQYETKSANVNKLYVFIAYNAL